MKKKKRISKLICIFIMLIFVGFIVDIGINKYDSTIENEEKKPIDNKEEVNDTVTVLAEEMVSLSHYGHDCYGCGGYTASGYYIGDGRIYYEDSTFGLVRVVAADKKYPLGSIVRMEYYDSVITAIVLDRGGGIGDGKNFQIDLLVSNEAESYELGIINNVTLEVLRLGY